MIPKTLITIWYIITHGIIGMATTFSSVDVFNPNPLLACKNRILDDEKDFIIAHKNLPCGTKIFLYNLRNKKSTIATVEDRGPRHAKFDLSPAVTKSIKSNGMELILGIPLIRQRSFTR